MIKHVTFLLILVFSGALSGQTAKPSGKVSQKDSLALVKLWSKITTAFDKGDSKTIHQNSDNVVECRCGTDDSTRHIRKWPADKFATQVIKKYNLTRELQNIMKIDHPRIIVSPKHNSDTLTVYSVLYVLDTPSEHEGAKIYFDFAKRSKSFKMFSIWTVPE